MKIKGAPMEELQTCIASFFQGISADNVLEYLEELRNDNRVKDLGMRFRWDIFYAATHRKEITVRSTMSGYTDDHIDTALRALIPAELERLGVKWV